MPFYQWQGINKAGKRTKGAVNAESVRALKDALKRDGVFLTSHSEGSGKGKTETGKKGGLNREVELTGFFANRITTTDVGLVTRQLATLLRAGIPLLKALSAIVDQLDKEVLKRIMSTVRTKVNEGDSLASALGEHPNAFPDLYVNMVRAGESAGNLEIVLEKLTDHLEAQSELKSKVMSAMYYPIIMGVVGFGVMVFMFIYVIPKVTMIFEGQQQTLPFLTRALIAFTDFIGKPLNIVLVIAFFVGAFYGFRAWTRTEEGRYKWDKIKLRMPLVGRTVRMISIQRFAGTLSTLLASGVPLLRAMDIVKSIISNKRLQEVLEDVRNNVREGDSIAAPLKRSGEFDPIVTHMIAIGESSGRLEDMLENISNSYTKQLDNRLRALTSLLEPAMIVLMGGAVGLIVFAILVPILKISQGIG